MGYITLPFRLPEQFKPERESSSSAAPESESFPVSFPVAFQPPRPPKPKPRVRGWVTRAKLILEN